MIGRALCGAAAALALTVSVSMAQADTVPMLVLRSTSTVTLLAGQPESAEPHRGAVAYIGQQQVRVDLLRQPDDSAAAQQLFHDAASGTLRFTTEFGMMLRLQPGTFRKAITRVGSLSTDSVVVSIEERGDGPALLGYPTQRVLVRFGYRMRMSLNGTTTITSVQQSVDGFRTLALGDDLPTSLIGDAALGSVDEAFLRTMFAGSETDSLSRALGQVRGVFLQSVTRQRTVITTTPGVVSTREILDSASVVSVTRQRLARSVLQPPQNVREYDFAEAMLGVGQPGKPPTPGATRGTKSPPVRKP